MCQKLHRLQDMVARRGKMVIFYKRPGQRVIINARGDLLVRPTFAEANVQRTPGGTVLTQLSLYTFCKHRL